MQHGLRTQVSTVRDSLSGYAVSVGLHGAILLVAVFGLPSFERERPAPPVPIDIQFLQIAETTNVPQREAPEPKVEEQQEAQPAPPQQKTTAQAAPEPVTEEAVPTLSPEPAPEPVPEAVPVKAAPKPKPKPEISPEERDRRRLRASVVPRSKPKPPSRLDRSRLAALIDRSKKEEDARVLSEKKEKDTPQKSQEKARKPSLFSSSRARLATADLQSALRVKLAQCWNIPLGAEGIEKMRATVRIYLRPDGTLSRSPQLINPGDMSNGFYRVFAESTIQAVRLCEPFDEASGYVKSGNTYIDFLFDPSDYGG